MHSTLLLKAFKKAKSEIHSDKPTQLAKHLSDYIQEQSREPYGEKSLRTHYNTAKKGDTIDLKKFVTNALSVYLGYESFENYIKAQPTKPIKKKPLFKNYTWPLAAVLFILMLFWGYNQLTKERWMVWQENHYLEIKFDEKLLQEGKLKRYSEERIENFKQLQTDCNTRYKTNTGKPLVWYGKNPAGKLQYYTSPGLHPETGKTLKELTKYMYNKYVCPK